MKRLLPLFMVMAVAVSNGCQTGTYRTTESNPTQTSLSAGSSIQPINIDGDWLTFFHCEGNDYLLETKIQSDGNSFRLFFSGQAAPMKMPLQGRSGSRAKKVPPVLNGTFDGELSSFIASSVSGSNGMTIKGVFASAERFAAKIENRYWSRSSLLIGVRKKHRGELDELRAEADSKLGQIVARSQLGTMFRVFAFKTRGLECDKDETRWMERVRELITKTQVRHSNPSQLAIAMFNEENFDPFFDKPLRKIGQSEGQSIANRLVHSSGCGRIDKGNRFGQEVLNDLAAILRNSPPLTRNYVMTSNAAATIIRQWLNAIDSRLLAFGKLYAENPEKGLARADSLIGTANDMQALIWPMPIHDYEKVLSATKNALRKKVVLKAFAQHYRTTVDTFSGLNRLGGFPASDSAGYRLLSKTEKSEVESKIKNRVNDGALNAAEAYIAQNSNEQSYDHLEHWKTRFPSLSALLSSTNRTEIDQMINTHREQVASSCLATRREQFSQALSQQSTAMATLSAAIVFEQRMRRVPAALLDRPQFQQFAKDRTRRRRRELTNAASQIQQKIANCANKTELEAVRLTYLYPEDERTSEGVSFLNAIAARLKVVAPFTGYPSEDYFNALYGADFAALRKMDKAFTEPYRNLMNKLGGYNMLSAVGAFTELLTGSAIKSENFVASMQLSIDNLSLIVPMFAVYLIDYQVVYHECIEQDAATFEKTTVMQTVYQDSSGFEYSRTTDAIYRDYYKVNRRFAHVFEAVGLTEPDSVLGNLIGMMFARNGRINVHDITSGTRKMMRRFQCRSPEITRMEKNMLSYFNTYLQRSNKARRALFGR